MKKIKRASCMFLYGEAICRMNSHSGNSLAQAFSTVFAISSFSRFENALKRAIIMSKNFAMVHQVQSRTVHSSEARGRVQ